MLIKSLIILLELVFSIFLEKTTKKTSEHFDAEIKQCPRCHETTKAEFPEGIHGKLQYGNGLKAFVIHLMISQMVAVNRVKKIHETFIASGMSKGI